MNALVTCTSKVMYSSAHTHTQKCTMHYSFNNITWVTSYRISQYTVYNIKCAKLQEVITQLISSKKRYINI